jgi:hypothetical protein
MLNFEDLDQIIVTIYLNKSRQLWNLLKSAEFENNEFIFHNE